MKISQALLLTFLVISFLGFLDSTYLAVEHFRGEIPPCTVVQGCEEVTTSKYSVVLGVPLALVGSFYYLVVFSLVVLYWQKSNFLFLKLAMGLTVFGFIFSLVFLYLQIFVIEAICIYCLFSLLTSTGLFVLSLISFYKNRIKPAV